MADVQGVTGVTENIDWFDFVENDVVYSLQLNFLFSSWGCIFGKGCPGIIYKDSDTYQPSIGCCTHGAYLDGPEDYKATDKWFKKLTNKDMDPKRLAELRKNGWANIFNADPDNFHGKTRIKDGACVFSLRGTEAEGGRIGCAFLHLATRLKEQGIEDVDHSDVMPAVCWQLPFKREQNYDEDGELSDVTIYPWHVGDWFEGGADEDGVMEWWCVAEGSLVTTERGLVLIEDVSENDRVLTRAGFRQVLKRWDNGKRSVIKIVYEGGSITVTEDHKLLTDQGFLTGREIVALTANTVATVGSDVRVGARELVTLGANVTPSGSEGLASSDVLARWDAGQMLDIAADTSSAQVVKLITLGNGANQGIPQMDSQVGGDAVQLGHSVTAAGPLATEVNALQGVDVVGLDKGIGVDGRHVLSVHQAGETQVYDLTVEGQHEYVANGVVVHNCVDDAAAYTPGGEPLFRTAKNELAKLIGGMKVYERILPELERRYAAQYVKQMRPARPDGRSLIPLAVKGRTEIV